MFLTGQIVRLLVNTFPADEEYPVLNRDNLTIPIQMQLSQKNKTCCQFFTAFLKSRWNFEHFYKKDDAHRFCNFGIRTPKTWSYQCLKSLVWEDPSTSNMVNVSNHCWNIHHSISVIFIDHCQGNWVGGSLCFWHAKSRECLLRHLFSMKSILFLTETI